jgi:hypothetical protein
MKKAERARKLLAEFKRLPNIPESVIAIVSSADNGDSNDSRRWVGRTAAACLSQWEKVTSQCSGFHQIMTRVKTKACTGSPEDEDFVRAVTAIRNRSCEVSNLYSVLRSTSYPGGKTFSIVDAYHFLVAQNYIVAKSQKKIPATIWNAARCVQYNERVGQRWFRTKSQSHSLERSTSTQHVSSNYRVWNRFRLRGGDALTQTMLWDEPIVSQHVSLNFSLGFSFGRTGGDALIISDYITWSKSHICISITHVQT